MPRELFSNNAIAQLSQPLHIGDDRVYVDDLDVFPTPAADEFFTIIVVGENCQDVEIIEVTGKGTQWLVASRRGAQGSREGEFVSHARVVHQLTAESLQTITDGYRGFAGLYLGTATVDPTAHPDGSALQAGQLYFNTATGAMRVFRNGQWNDISVASPSAQNRWVYTLKPTDDPRIIPSPSVGGRPVQPDIYGNTMALDDTHMTMIAVFVNGVRQVASDPTVVPPVVGDYTVDKAGDRIVMATDLADGTDIHVLEYVGLDNTNIPPHDADHDIHNAALYAPIAHVSGPGGFHDDRYVRMQPTVAWRSVTVHPTDASADYPTIQAAIDAESKLRFVGTDKGLAIKLLDGVHVAPADSWGWQSDAALSVTSLNNDPTKCTIDTASMPGAWLAGLTVGHALYTWISNITIKSSTGWDAAHRRQGVYVGEANTVQFWNCTFEGLQTAILISATAMINILNCTFRAANSVGIFQYLQGGYTRIDGCTITGCTYAGVSLYGSGDVHFTGAKTTITGSPYGILARHGVHVQGVPATLGIDHCTTRGVDAAVEAKIHIPDVAVTDSPNPGWVPANFNPVPDSSDREGAIIYNAGAPNTDDDNTEDGSTSDDSFTRIQRLHHA